MNPLHDAEGLLQSMVEAIDAEDMAAAEALLAAHDQRVHQYADSASGEPDYREQLIALQRLQLALIDLLRGRRDAVADELQSAGRVGRAARAYLAQGEP